MFCSYILNTVRLKNRLVRSATRDYLFHMDGTLTDEYIQIYEELAKNNVGLIIAGVFKVNNSYLSKMPQGSVDGEQYVQGLKVLSDTVHRHGSVVYGQLSYYAHYESKNLDDSEKEQIIKKYVKGAHVLQGAGFDGVQIHLAHSSYMGRYIEDSTNGELEERMKLPCEIIRRVKEKCGADFTVICKINGNGHSLDELVHALSYMQVSGLDGVEVSGKDFQTREKAEKSYYEDVALDIKKKLDVPVILVGGIYSKSEIQRLLDKGIDLISMSRPFICEPDFAEKIRQEDYVAKCIRCSQCLTLQERKYKRCVFGEEITYLRETFEVNKE